MSVSMDPLRKNAKDDTFPATNWLTNHQIVINPSKSWAMFLLPKNASKISDYPR